MTQISLSKTFGAVAALGAALLQVRAPAAYAADAPGEAAPAQPEQPAGLFQRGLEEYDARRYRNAIDFFSRAYEKTHAPAILFNIAQARRLLGDCADAVTMYEAFIADDPSSPDVSRARAWLDKLRPCNPRPEAATPKTQEAATTVPSPPRAVVRSPEVSRSLASPVFPVSQRRPLVVGVLGGVAIMALGAGVYAAWRAADLQDQTSLLFRNGGTWTSDSAAVEREGERAQTESILLLSTAVVAGVAAYLVHRLYPAPRK